MDDTEKKVIQMEERIKSELGDDGDDGQVWRCVNAHSTRIDTLDKVIWKGNGDSITTQIVKLRTELRTIAVVVSLLVPAVMKVIDLWLERQ